MTIVPCVALGPRPPPVPEPGGCGMIGDHGVCWALCRRGREAVPGAPSRRHGRRRLASRGLRERAVADRVGAARRVPARRGGGGEDTRRGGRALPRVRSPHPAGRRNRLPPPGLLERISTGDSPPDARRESRAGAGPGWPRRGRRGPRGRDGGRADDQPRADARERSPAGSQRGDRDRGGAATSRRVRLGRRVRPVPLRGPGTPDGRAGGGAPGAKRVGATSTMRWATGCSASATSTRV